MNETVFNFFNNFALQNETLDSVIIFLTDKFALILVFSLIIFLFTHKHKEDNIRNIFVIFLSALFAWVIAKAIKFFYFSPRPFEVLDTANVLFEYEPGDSFPSGHATFFSALATSFYFYHKYLAWIYIIGALLIGASRIAAGIHWPVDILVGYALGGILGYLAYRLFRR
ncbi:phosphatase PAP2 family protein [bacterium]|jgi:undecaprenyl-diphosphatase|nr:phosphatase PAP2 family protein [bacterium]MBT3730228.1 phosphatase PAP2 family protein [bacterium]MBT4894661.1 phosphatase PAP2 family protein [bacterium]